MQLGEDTTTMSMTLNPVNEAAFQKAVQSLETLNRAAVFHPTGTGKSCIAWKVVEALMSPRTLQSTLPTPSSRSTRWKSWGWKCPLRIPHERRNKASPLGEGF